MIKKKSTIIILIVLALLALSVYFSNSSNEIKNYNSEGEDIIAFGDSLIEGVGSTQNNDFVSILSKKNNRPIINLGNSGDTTKDGLNRIGELDKYNPQIVILLLGGNDYLKRIPKEETVNNLEILIDNIQKRDSMVLLLGIKGGILNDSYKEDFERLNRFYNTAYVSDVLDGLLGNQKFMSDLIHPNDIGYSLIAERIYPVLDKLIK